MFNVRLANPRYKLAIVDTEPVLSTNPYRERHYPDIMRVEAWRLAQEDLLAKRYCPVIAFVADFNLYEEMIPEHLRGR